MFLKINPSTTEQTPKWSVRLLQLSIRDAILVPVSADYKQVLSSSLVENNLYGFESVYLSSYLLLLPARNIKSQNKPEEEPRTACPVTNALLWLALQASELQFNHI